MNNVVQLVDWRAWIEWAILNAPKSVQYGSAQYFGLCNRESISSELQHISLDFSAAEQIAPHGEE